MSYRELNGRGAGFYANPDLAERIERVDVSEIMHKIPLLMSYGFNWVEWSEVFSSKASAWQKIERFRMKCDDIPMIHRLCVSGVGLAVLPHAMVLDDVENGRLVPVLQQFSPGRTKFYALWGTRSPQVRLIEEFVDHLDRRLIAACLAFDERQ